MRVFYPELSRDQLVDRLRQQVALLSALLPLKRAVLFGSWAKGRATAFSDIDVLIVYDDPSRDGAYRLVRHCLKLRGLEPHIYTESEAALLQPTLERMTSESIDLDGGPESG